MTVGSSSVGSLQTARPIARMSSESAPGSATPVTLAPAIAPLVLLVEDDRGMRRYLRATLVDQRLRVVETETGSEGLVQATAHNPDLVLLDLGLPDMDGIH